MVQSIKFLIVEPSPLSIRMSLGSKYSPQDPVFKYPYTYELNNRTEGSHRHIKSNKIKPSTLRLGNTENNLQRGIYITKQSAIVWNGKIKNA